MSFGLNRKTDYSLVALAALGQEKLAGEGPLSARQISARHDLPLPLLMNALKELHRAGVICSRRGVGGGYYLDREPEEITLKDVIEALEGPVCVTLCSDDHPHDHAGNPCQLVCFCPISNPMKRFNGMLNDFLAKVTLQNLIASESVSALPTLGVPV